MASTIRDIAKHSGLAIGTVSKFLNGQSVRDKNKQKIESAIAALSYQVNQIARGLKTNKSMTVGVLTADLSDVFAGAIISETGHILNEYGYGMIVCEYADDSDMYETQLKFLLSKKVDGIISGSPHKSIGHLKNIIGAIPMVFYDSVDKSVCADSVLVDNMESIYTATTEIIKRGHRRIGIIVSTESSMTSDERYKGYINALDTYYIDVTQELIRNGSYTIEGGYRAMNELLDMSNAPSIVIVTNYYMTIGAYMAIHNRKLSIPGDISFMGFDKIIIADMIKPALSIIEQPMTEISRSVAELLLDRMSGKKTGSPIIQRLKSGVFITDSIATIDV